jgi:hypothetical protein
MQAADSLQDKLKSADECMSSSRPEDALLLYKEAWDHADAEPEESKVWILLSTANAAIRCNKVADSKEAVGKAYAFVHTGIVVGNPLFHLLLGLTYHLLDENPTAKEEHFARAIICGGAKIFNGEEEHLVKQLKRILEFPAQTDTWESYEGCSRDTLNGATGYMATLIEERIGKALPYEAVDCSDDSESEDDYDTEEENDEGLETQERESLETQEREGKRQKCEE